MVDLYWIYGKSLVCKIVLGNNMRGVFNKPKLLDKMTNNELIEDIIFWYNNTPESINKRKSALNELIARTKTEAYNQGIKDCVSKLKKG